MKIITETKERRTNVKKYEFVVVNSALLGPDRKVPHEILGPDRKISKKSHKIRIEGHHTKETRQPNK